MLLPYSAGLPKALLETNFTLAPGETIALAHDDITLAHDDIAEEPGQNWVSRLAQTGRAFSLMSLITDSPSGSPKPSQSSSKPMTAASGSAGSPGKLTE